MNQQSINMREIRNVANGFDADTIETCIQLAMKNKDNPCYPNDELEETINVLAKGLFIRSQMEQGLSLAHAARELGKRIRSLQNDIPSPLEGEGYDCMDAGGTSPRMGEGRIMQEQLSRATQEQLPRVGE